MNYIQRMRNLREDHDKTQQNIADILGTSQTMYARYERGANELPIHHLLALCHYYRVSADYILGLVDEKGKSCPFITSLHSVIIIMYPQTIFLDYQITRDSQRNHLLRAIVTGNFVDISFFITYSVIGNRKTRYVLPESFKTHRFGHDSACTLNNKRRNSI